MLPLPQDRARPRRRRQRRPLPSLLGLQTGLLLLGEGELSALRILRGRHKLTCLLPPSAAPVAPHSIAEPAPQCQQAHWKRTRESHKLECHALSERNFIYAWEFRKKQEGREIMDRTMAAKGMKPVSISGGQGESAAPRVVDFGGITIVD